MPRVEREPRTVRILDWNLLHARTHNDRCVVVVPRTFEAVRSDVVALQEVKAPLGSTSPDVSLLRNHTVGVAGTVWKPSLRDATRARIGAPYEPIPSERNTAQ